MKRLLLVGGGHAHVEVMRALAADPPPAIAVTLLTPAPSLVYTGMLPGHVAGHYRLDEITLDLASLAERARVRIVQGIATHVDTTRREVLCTDTTALPYDALSLDVGSEPMTEGVAGVPENAVTARPLRRLVEGWERVVARAGRGEVQAITLVGGGAAGVELALAMSWRLRDLAPRPHIRILEHGPRILPGFPEGARARLLEHLRREAIGVHTSSTVREVGPDYVRLVSRIEFATDATFWLGGAAGPGWLADSGLSTDAAGFLRIDDRLQSVSHRGVFAAGDCAVDERHPVPRAGVFAVRAGPALAANLRAFLEARPLLPHQPKRRYLALIGTGDRNAVGTWGPFSWQGRWAWRWKERIDRGWLGSDSGVAKP